MVTYLAQCEFRDKKYIKVIKRPKGYFDCIIKSLLLGHSSSSYSNKISGWKQLKAAIIQTVWCSLLLCFFVFMLSGVSYFDICEKVCSGRGFEQGLYSSVIGIIVAVFGAAFWRERRDVIRRWRFLADAFNLIIQVEPPKGSCDYNKREHFFATYGHDILTLEMWSHRTFRSSFKDIIERSNLYARNYNIEESNNFLARYARDGIDYDEAVTIISKYIVSLLPVSDKPDWYIDNHLKSLEKSHQIASS